MDTERGELTEGLAGGQQGGNSGEGKASVDVAAHYNAVPEKGIGERTGSRIFYLRNFNNWIKSMLIGEFLDRLKASGITRITALDLCCGKGGDLLKWKKGGIRHLVATDIANISMEQCENRYKQMKEKSFSNCPVFSAEFINIDSTMERLLDYVSDKNIVFDLCSCQFSLHYSFESERKARQMLLNATERLRPGGYFIGTLPDAERIVHCIRQSAGNVFSNDVVRLEYSDPKAFSSGRIPVFGASFNFNLDTQVNCPEYLVHFPVIVKLLEEYDMELVYMKRFPEAMQYYKDKEGGQTLLQQMRSLERYPPESGVNLVGREEEYSLAKRKLDEIIGNRTCETEYSVGTLSESEWQVVCMYIVFAFQKKMSG
ncbi:hypothetical protein AB6A40_000526 [Gnathostoma spinigerum]|uniref:mRNA cap guanine-N(7) methyltransferase n=1 Tax=Gnathostoma spinigerum TaxID=75299 RepID=A0ABD6EAW0_9BILA